MKNSEKIGRVSKLHFRVLPRFGAFSARDLRLKRYKVQPFVYHPWKFEDDVLSRFVEDLWTKWHPENKKILDRMSSLQILFSVITDKYALSLKISWKSVQAFQNKKSSKKKT